MTFLLTTDQMYRADKAAMNAGISGECLMESAGWQVAASIRKRLPVQPVMVLCGPGNNGGDGYVAARLLQSWGWPVRLALLGDDPSCLKGDAAAMAARWHGPTKAFDPECLPDRGIIIDALFGAGLSRGLSGAAAEMVEAVNQHRRQSSVVTVVSVDVPSGLDGNRGTAAGPVIQADVTVTFFRAKPGHFLFPGRGLCGDLVVADIGIAESVLASLHPCLWLNDPQMWRGCFPTLSMTGHKYSRGHLLVAGGASMTGAARLAARAGRRIGTGLCSILAPDEALATYRAGDPGVIVEPWESWPQNLADTRRNAAVIGPGLGVGEQSRLTVLNALLAGKACVLDADALTSFAGRAEALWGAGGEPVLTPHDGEYVRLFRHQGDRLSRARAAAAESDCVVLLKGADTVIASPDGRAAITANAPPSLATAGAGDVLAGMIGGLLAQGMPRFEAACAAAWVHGECAQSFGPGLVAEDLPEMLPRVLSKMGC